MANSERQLRDVVAKLEDCQTVLVLGDEGEASQLVSLAILQLKMKLNGIPDSDLKALCDALAPLEGPERTQDPKTRQGQSRRCPALLKLVK